MIRNLTPHLIRLASSADPATWIEIESSGQAVLESAPGKPSAHPGCPVPVVSPTTYGGISGLPEKCDEDDLLIVAFPVAARIPITLERVRARKRHLENDLAEYLYGESAALARAEIEGLDDKIQVLGCVVALGTGPNDQAIRWTPVDATEGRCPPSAVGTPRAVTRLVRP
jgi:hypothetical protein